MMEAVLLLVLTDVMETMIVLMAQMKTTVVPILLMRNPPVIRDPPLVRDPTLIRDPSLVRCNVMEWCRGKELASMLITPDSSHHAHFAYSY